MLTGSEIRPTKITHTKHLMILLHGIGANGTDLIDLARQFTTFFPNMHFVSPNAPFPYENATSGYQWFSFKDTSQEKLVTGLNIAASHLNEFIDDQLDALGLTEEHLIVLGFSQGTMVALHTLLRRPTPAALVLGFAGMIIAPELLVDELRSRPKVVLMHGDADSVVPIAHMYTTYKTLKKLNFDVSQHVYAGLGHSINQTSIDDSIAEIKKVYKHNA